MSKFYSVDTAIDAAITDAHKLRRAACLYQTLSESVSHTMRNQEFDQIRVPLDVISKSLKLKGAANFECRRLNDMHSKQYEIMSKVFGFAGIGAIPQNDSVIFVNLDSIPSVFSLQVA